MDAGLHFLDGALARSAAYLGLTLWVSLLIWPWLTRQQLLRNTRPLKNFFQGGSILFLISAIISINSATIAGFSPAIQNQWEMVEELKVLTKGLIPMISQTNFGRIWILQIVTVLLYSFFWLTGIRWQWSLYLAINLLLSTIILMGHTAEKGLLSSAFFFQWLHLLCVITWLSGLFMIAYFRFVGKVALERGVLLIFSRLATVAVVVIFLTGTLRLWDFFVPFELFVKSPYGWILIFKLLLLMALLPNAAYLRYMTRRSQPIDWRQFDRHFSRELFLVIMILMLSAMLSQLPSPRAFFEQEFTTIIHVLNGVWVW